MTVTSRLARSSLGALTVVSCVVVPNPAYDDGSSGMAGDSASTSSTSTTAGGDAQGSSGPGDPDGASTAAIPLGCGNGIPEDGEACDDGNEDNTDGCLTNCTIPRSCLDIFELDPTAQDGPHVIAPYDDRPPWAARCDMENPDFGGGWTELTLLDICEGRLDDMVTELQPAVIFARDEACRPSTRDESGGHGYYWDIGFPPGFTELYLDGYSIRNNSVPGEALDLIYSQTDWNITSSFPNGTMSVGSASDPGPVARWIDDGGAGNIYGTNEVVSYPRLGEPYALMQGHSTAVRIGWGEIGMNSEGMYPWWEGSIFVR